MMNHTSVSRKPRLPLTADTLASRYERSKILLAPPSGSPAAPFRAVAVDAAPSSAPLLLGPDDDDGPATATFAPPDEAAARYLPRNTIQSVLRRNQSFPTKLHGMLSRVEEEGLADIVSWQPHGRCFVVRRPDEFVSKVLPLHFRQSKLASFQRQLSNYGFVRIAAGRDRGGYCHELFLRDKPFLCQKMHPIRIKKGTDGEGKASPEPEPDFSFVPPIDSPGPSFERNEMERALRRTESAERQSGALEDLADLTAEGPLCDAPSKKSQKAEAPKPKSKPKRNGKRKRDEQPAEKADEEEEPGRPKRPLTAYNLFFRYKRGKILEAHNKSGAPPSKEAIARILAAPAGLEDRTTLSTPLAAAPSPAQVAARRRSAILASLGGRLAPAADSGPRRAHRRRTDGGFRMSFVELSRAVIAAWKSLDDVGREAFEDLAAEGREAYKWRARAYEERLTKKGVPTKKKKRKGGKAEANKGAKPRRERSSTKASKAKGAGRKRPRAPLRKEPAARKANAAPPVLPKIAFARAPSGPPVVTPLAVRCHAYRAPRYPPPPPPPPTYAASPPPAAGAPIFALPPGTARPVPFYPDPAPVFPDIFDEDVPPCVSPTGSGEVDDGTDGTSSSAAAAAALPAGATTDLSEASVEGIAAHASLDDFMRLVAALDDD